MTAVGRGDTAPNLSPDNINNVDVTNVEPNG